MHSGKEVNFDVSSISDPAEMKKFIYAPTPKSDGMMECRIIRERHGISKLFPRYILESDAGVFIMQAKKQPNNKTSHYCISMSKHDNVGTDLTAYLGKVRANFF